MKQIENEKFDAIRCDVTLAGECIYEAIMGVTNYIVDINKQTCSCRKYDLTGVPCLHALSVILKCRLKVENYIHKYYSLHAFSLAYQNIITHIPDITQWSHSDADPILPPKRRIMPGRPKKLRKKTIDEKDNSTSIRRNFEQARCGNCRQFGHNKRKCPEPQKEVIRKNIQTTQTFVITGEGTGGDSNKGKCKVKSTGMSWGGVRVSPRGKGRGRGVGRGKISGQGNPLGPDGLSFTGEPPVSRGRGWSMRGRVDYKRPNSNVPARAAATIGQSSQSPQLSNYPYIGSTTTYTTLAGPSTFGHYPPHFASTSQVKTRPTRFGEIMFATMASRNANTGREQNNNVDPLSSQQSSTMNTRGGGGGNSGGANNSGYAAF